MKTNYPNLKSTLSLSNKIHVQPTDNSNNIQNTSRVVKITDRSTNKNTAKWDNWFVITLFYSLFTHIKS